MKTKPRTIFATLGLALTLALASSGAANAQACLDNRQIQDAVASGQIMSLADVLAFAGIDSNTEVLSVQVCDEGGRLVYHIGILTPAGEAQNLILGAQ
jgi:acyl-coenzyme A thioesterase PaaI-like protein